MNFARIAVTVALLGALDSRFCNSESRGDTR